MRESQAIDATGKYHFYDQTINGHLPRVTIAFVLNAIGDLLSSRIFPSVVRRIRGG